MSIPLESIKPESVSFLLPAQAGTSAALVRCQNPAAHGPNPAFDPQNSEQLVGSTNKRLYTDHRYGHTFTDMSFWHACNQGGVFTIPRLLGDPGMRALAQAIHTHVVRRMQLTVWHTSCHYELGITPDSPSSSTTLQVGKMPGQPGVREGSGVSAAHSAIFPSPHLMPKNAPPFIESGCILKELLASTVAGPSPMNKGCDAVVDALRAPAFKVLHPQGEQSQPSLLPFLPSRVEQVFALIITKLTESNQRNAKNEEAFDAFMQCKEILEKPDPQEIWKAVGSLSIGLERLCALSRDRGPRLQPLLDQSPFFRLSTKANQEAIAKISEHLDQADLTDLKPIFEKPEWDMLRGDIQELIRKTKFNFSSPPKEAAPLNLISGKKAKQNSTRTMKSIAL